MQSWNTIGSHRVTESNSKKNRGKLKSLDESNFFSPISPNFSASSISFDGSSVFWGSDSDVKSEIEERKAYPLPQPASSSVPRTIDAYQRVSGFVSQNMSISSSSSTGFSSDNEDFVPHHRDFSSFRACEEIEYNLWSRTSYPGSRASSTCTIPSHPTLWEDNVECPIANHESGMHPCHPLPLPPSLPIGSSQHRQSKWKKGRLLGRGTFGHVYAGFNSENGQMCAIKEVRVIFDDRSSKECLKQLNQEITLLSKLSHPNIVQYYESELGGDKLSVYLEYVSGGSIHKLLREYGPFKEPVIQSYTRQILSGIAYLHRKDTVHRDIKGANVLVDPNGEIKLVDFGMAKRIASCSSMLSFKGSPYWMAPEVIMNASGSSLPVDIWSLGCTVLEMATAKPPWSQYEGVAAIFKIANSKDFPEIPSRLSKNAQNFVRLCLRRDPSARPTAAQLLRHPFLNNQMTIEVANFYSVHETLPSTFDSRQSMTASNSHSSRPTFFPSNGDHGLRPTFVSSRASMSCSWDTIPITSSPISPCSSSE